MENKQNPHSVTYQSDPKTTRERVNSLQQLYLIICKLPNCKGNISKASNPQNKEYNYTHRASNPQIKEQKLTTHQALNVKSKSSQGIKPSTLNEYAWTQQLTT
ncbi:hypothetical protein MTR_3g449370 [Medicago truncatula]|uniref:Uncharacterized protein n=1 Tax=Medicago truncatula TaxID=3880 RepID=A0A072UVF7_MEDTR|nr:hypothetical protein MTR_3g449370 [Medicago truncatula]